MRTTTILLLGCALPVIAQVDDSFFRKTLAIEPRFVWPSDTRSASQITKQDVMGLLGQIFPDPSWEVVTDIKEFRFVPMDRGRRDKLWLVIDADATGRGYFGDITAIYCQGRNCIWRRESWDGGDSDLKDILVDADVDGVWEIVTRDRAGIRGNADSLQMFRYFIRNISETPELVDNSRRYKEYFTRVLLPRIRQEQADALSNVPESRQRKALDYLAGQTAAPSEEPAAEADRVTDRLITVRAAMIMALISYVNDDYRRRVLGEESAGVENAIRWAHSPDPEIREFAIDVLEHIDHPSALSELKRLAASGDQKTRERVADVLELRRELGLDAKKVK